MSNYNTQLQSNNVDLQEVIQSLQNKAAGGTQATPVISVNSTNGLITATAGAKSSTHQLAFQPAKTITPTTASQIAVSSGYYTGGNITVAAVPTQTKSVTPKATNQNVTPDSGKFLSNVAVAAIPSQYIVPSGTLTISSNGTHNVKNYASAVVNVEGGMSSGEQVEWSANEDAIISKTISGSYFNDRVKTIGSYAFENCTSLTTVSFPACTTIGSYAFENCTSLTTVSFPACTTINPNAFRNCKSLTTVSFPACTFIGQSAFRYTSLTTVSFPACEGIGLNAFYSCTSLTTVSFPACEIIASSAFGYCTSLTTASFPACEIIHSYAFGDCYNLKSLYLTGSFVCKLSVSNAFTSTPIGGYSTSAGTYGSIYVPASLLTSYKKATNWTYFSSRFVGI